MLPDRIHEDPETASVPRVAGGFTPFPPPHIDPEDVSETKINPVAFVRNSITIWFDREVISSRKVSINQLSTHRFKIHPYLFTKGIVLFDPPS